MLPVNDDVCGQGFQSMSQLGNSVQDLHIPLRRRNGHPRTPARGGRRLCRQAQTRDKVVFHHLDIRYWLDIVRCSRYLSGQYCLNLYNVQVPFQQYLWIDGRRMKIHVM